MKAFLWLIPLFLASCSYVSQFQDAPAGEESPLAGIISEDIALPVGKPEAQQEQAAERQDTFTVREGETIRLSPKAVDPDSDNLAYAFSEPLDAEGAWQTREGDAGKYQATITVSDGKSTATRKVTIIVTPLNNPPVLEVDSEMVVPEGSTVLIDARATDSDNDPVRITYSGWMVNRSRATGFTDAGSYIVIVTASDGKVSVSREVRITVTDVNRPPVIESIVQE